MRISVKNLFALLRGGRPENANKYHLYSPKKTIYDRKQVTDSKLKLSFSDSNRPSPLVDEIDTEKVQDQTAHDVVGKRPESITSQLYRPGWNRY